MTIIFFSVGNPQRSRHSAGHRVLEHLVEEYGNSTLARPSKAAYSVATDGEDVFFVRSETYMNESDQALKQFLHQNRIRPGDSSLVIVHDDFERPLGTVGLSPVRKNESHNGLKALKPVLEGISTMKVAVMNVGIGPKPKNASSNTMSKWVLAPFSDAEQQRFDTQTAIEAEKLAAGIVTGERQLV